MKYTLSLDVEVPRETLVQLYVNPQHWPKWQDSLVSYELLSGENRQAGSKTKLVNRFAKKNIEIGETVEVNRLPELYTCTYEAAGTWNRVENRFENISAHKTRWEFHTEFKCGAMLKVMSLLMPGMFRKASLKEMMAFKKFAEQSDNGACSQ